MLSRETICSWYSKREKKKRLINALPHKHKKRGMLGTMLE